MTKQTPAEPAGEKPSGGNELIRKCRAGDMQACETLSRGEDYGSIDGAEKIEPAQPARFWRQAESSCASGQRAKLFALHSRRIEKILLAESEAKQAEIFNIYCGMVREVIAKMPGGDPAAAVYMRKEVPVGSKGRKRPMLCISPDPRQPRCDLGFDMIIEDGVLKKDEL